jgi:hypothetical protein
LGKTRDLTTAVGDRAADAREFSRHGFCSCCRMAITSYRDLDVWQISMDLEGFVSGRI